MRATIGNATIKTVSKSGLAAQSSKIREAHSKPNALLFVSTRTHLYKGTKSKKKKGLNKTLFSFFTYIFKPTPLQL